MTIRIYKPTTPGRRNASVNLHTEVTKKSPEKSLLRPIHKKGGRNHHGVITVHGRGGGHKRRYRSIDFKRKQLRGKTAIVVGIEYDPNRSCHIALLEFDAVSPEGKPIRKRCYIPAPKDVTDGDELLTSETPVEPRPGACMLIRHIPTGLNIHCVELKKGKGAQIARSAGSSIRLTNKDDRFATVVLPSGEMRQVPLDCWATVGEVGNSDHQRRRLGKAGKSRHLGRRPKTRGVAMDHATHPLGGGEGRSKSGRAPSSKSGVLSKGGSTRNRKQYSSKLIIRRRKSKRYGQLR
jgi:large subunit ribosomal protein L2